VTKILVLSFLKKKTGEGVHPGLDRQSPSRRIGTYQTKNTKNQNNNNLVARNQTKKKKKKKKTY
jgi:hypothetical protein